jgi:uncharacterized repeat protein (TIGR02543 family)
MFMKAIVIFSLLSVTLSPLFSLIGFEDAQYSTIFFDTNGGSLISSITTKVGDRIVIPETTKEGFTFVDWYKDDSFVKPFDLTIMPARDIKIYAMWDADLYTIHFETNGGNSISSIQGYFGDSIPLPNNPTRLGYTFQGWYRDSNYNNYFSLSSFPSMNMTLYAKWLVNQYTITFNTNGGNAIQTQTKNYNASLSIPTPAQVGHSFAGWFTDVGLSQPFIFTNMPAQNITLYAKWTINQYTITFETNGGSIISSITGNYGDSVTAPSNPTWEGHTFNGWFANANLTESTSIPTTIPAENLRLYAKWTINQYTITFNTNGGNAIQTQTKNYNASLSIPTPAQVGHSFAGWFTDVGLSQPFIFTNMPAQNITLYAKWTINQYTITFETNGGSIISSITGNYGDSVTAPSNPTWEGHTFNGWFANANLTESTSIPTTIPAENLGFYAGWLPLSPKITINKTPVNSYHSGSRGGRTIGTILPDLLNFSGPDNNGLYSLNVPFTLPLYDFNYERCIYLYKVNFEGQYPDQGVHPKSARRISIRSHMAYGFGTFNLDFRFAYYGESWNFVAGFYNLTNGYYFLEHTAACPSYI